MTQPFVNDLQALALDDGAVYNERLQLALHRLQLRAELYQQPERPEDAAAMIIEQVGLDIDTNMQFLMTLCIQDPTEHTGFTLAVVCCSVFHVEETDSVIVSTSTWCTCALSSKPRQAGLIFGVKHSVNIGDSQIKLMYLLNLGYKRTIGAVSLPGSDHPCISGGFLQTAQIWTNAGVVLLLN